MVKILGYPGGVNKGKMYKIKQYYDTPETRKEKWKSFWENAIRKSVELKSLTNVSRQALLEIKL